MRTRILLLLLLTTTAFADTTYQIDPNSRIDEKGSRSQRCNEATYKSLELVVQDMSHIKLAKDGVYYKRTNAEFVKATRSMDNYGFVDINDTTTIVLVVYRTSVMDKAHADTRTKIMISVIKRAGKGRPASCSERWFGFGKAVQS